MIRASDALPKFCILFGLPTLEKYHPDTGAPPVLSALQYCHVIFGAKEVLDKQVIFSKFIFKNLLTNRTKVF